MPRRHPRRRRGPQAIEPARALTPIRKRNSKSLRDRSEDDREVLEDHAKNRTVCRAAIKVKPARPAWAAAKSNRPGDNRQREAHLAAGFSIARVTSCEDRRQD